MNLLLRCPDFGDASRLCTLAHLRNGEQRVGVPRLAPTLRLHAFSPDEVQRLHAAARGGVRDRLLLLLLFTTALRVGGLSRLPAVSPRDTWCRTVEKGGQIHPVALAPCVRDALSAYLAAHPASPEAHYLLPSRRNADHPISTTQLKRWFRGLCARAGVVGPHAHIHTTRHTVAVALRLAGCRIADIQAFLGHASPSTTLAVYCTPDFHQLVHLLRLPWFSGPVDHHRGVDDTLLRALAPSPLTRPPPAA